ncbi:hypothetical protein [Limosilactobacillus gastricus]|uniref:hypothetical protein n=1 Tax=Limosilactobacillus gastricus TaxID=227942 RepID=UPI0002E2029F|nr:hypothetical protein [Limosilactobacillus gastricus]
MLKAYRKENRKIALGLMSFIPEWKNDYERLNHELDWATSGNRQVMLWENPFTNQLTGIIIFEQGEHYILVRHLSFSPSDRSGRNVYDVFNDLHQQFSDCRLMGTLAIQPLISNWEKELYYQRQQFKAKE